MNVEQIIAVDFATTADLDKCLSDSDYFTRCFDEWVSDIDHEKVKTNLRMIGEVKDAS